MILRVMEEGRNLINIVRFYAKFTIKRRGKEKLMRNQPGIAKMIIAYFLTSIIAPIILGTVLAFNLNGRLEGLNFKLC